MSDKIVVLKEGRVQQIGTPQELSRRPATRFVAEFLGSNNVLPLDQIFFDGDMAKGRIRGSGDPMVLSRHQPADLNGGPSYLVVRPEETIVQNVGPGLPGIIRAIRYAGITRCLVIEISGGAMVSAADMKDHFRVGEPVFISWRPDRTCIVSNGPETHANV